jgi:hypothetical protein
VAFAESASLAADAGAIVGELNSFSALMSPDRKRMFFSRAWEPISFFFQIWIGN